MKKQFICTHGHRWEIPLDGGLALAVQGIACPDCGAPAETLPPSNVPLDDPEHRTNTETHADAGPASVDTTPSQVTSPQPADRTTIPPQHQPLFDQLPPALVGHPRYAVTALLGAGGMGAVYKAEHRVMDRPVALKVIRRNLLDQSGAIERFEREVKAAARLSHPNIVMAHDAEAAGDTHFLVMEFVEGVNFGEIVAERGPLSIREACDAVHQALLGLQHAHERGMIHRDLKPHNLMRTSSGRVKILDFGLARFVRETAPQGPLTEVGTVMGTADYVAPEQATNAHEADIRADIYSLGCTLYFLLTGKPPFEHGSVVQKIIQHLEADPPAIETRRTDVPAGLASVLRKMMAKRPADRYQTPAEAARAIRPFVQQATPRAAPAKRESGPASAAMAAARTPTDSPAGAHRPNAEVAQPITLVCARCGQKLKVREDLLGRKVKCPRCANHVPISPGGEAGVRTPADGARVAERQQAPRRGDQRSTASRRKRLMIAAVPALCLALAGVVYVVTDTGRIQVEFNGEDVHVEVLDGGRQVAVLDRQTGTEIRRRSGTYEVRLKSDRNDVRLSPTQVTLTRGGVQIVQITRVDKPTDTTPASVAATPTDADDKSQSEPATSIAEPFEIDLPVGTALGPIGELRKFDVGGAVFGVRFSPDGRHLLTGSTTADGKMVLRLWNLATSEMERQFFAFPHTNSYTFLPGGRRILAVDNAIKEWDLDSGIDFRPFGQTDGSFHNSYIGLAITSDGRRALSGSRGGLVQLWDVPTGTELNRLQLARGDVKVAVSPDDRYGLVTLHKIRQDSETISAVLMEMRTFSEARRLTPLPTNGVAFSRDSQHIVSGNNSGTIEVWSVATGEKIRQFTGHETSIWQVVFSPEGRHLLAGGASGAVALFDFQSGNKLWQWKGPSSPYSITFSRTGRYVAAGFENGSAYLFRVPKFDSAE